MTRRSILEKNRFLRSILRCFSYCGGVVGVIPMAPPLFFVYGGADAADYTGY